MKLNHSLNKKYTQISAYVIATAVIIYILSLLAKNAPAIVVTIGIYLRWFFRVVKPIFLGFVVAYLMEPLVDLFERMLRRIPHFQKKPQRLRLYSVLCTVLIVLAGVIILISVLMYSLTRQIRLANIDDVVNLISNFMNTFQEFIDSIIRRIEGLKLQTEGLRDIGTTLSNAVVNSLKSIAGSVPNSLGNLTSGISTAAFALIIGIWFMIDGRMIMNYLNKVMFALTSKRVNDRVHHFLRDVDFVFSGYIRGQLMDAFVMMCMISISLSLIGVRFAVLIGVIAGIGNLIPYVGPFLAYGGTAIVCLMEGRTKQLILAIIVLFIIQTIDGNLIGPKLLSRSVQVHPLLVIIFLIFGSAIGGLLGMLMAVPVGALIKLLFVRFIEREAAKKEALEASGGGNPGTPILAQASEAVASEEREPKETEKVPSAKERTRTTSKNKTKH